MNLPGIEHPVHVVGLTGGIGCGKTTVANLFRSLYRAHIIDADFIARQLVAPGEAALTEIVRVFGKRVLNDRGLDRKKLASIVFTDKSKLKKLDKIMDHRIHQQAMLQIEWVARRFGPSDPFVIYEAALLVEAGRHKDFDRLIVVGCDRRTQLQRVVERDHCTEQEARDRIAAQFPLSKKRRVANFYIDTSDDAFSLRTQVSDTYNRIITGRRK